MTLPLRYLSTEVLYGWVNRWLDAGLPAYLAKLARHAAIDLTASSDEELLAQLDELSLDVAECWYAVALACGGSVPLRKFIQGLAGDAMTVVPGEDVNVLLRGLPSLQVAEQIALSELARQLASEGVVGREDIQALLASASEEPTTPLALSVAEYLKTYGHQVFSLDPLHPTQAEAPADLWLGLSLYMSKDSRLPGQLIDELTAEREAAERRLLSQLSGQRLRMVELLLARLRAYERAREDSTFALQQAWPQLRRRLLCLGQRLAAREALASPDGLFFLPWSELLRTVHGEIPAPASYGMAEKNRSIWKLRAELSPPPCVPPATDPLWAEAMERPINLREIHVSSQPGIPMLQGLAASPGKRTGVALVCRHPEDGADIDKGHVLVASATTPRWTPLFARACAVVTDVGAATSHSSTVAREFRIPAVVGTQRATQFIRTGDRITVDGSSGSVFLVRRGDGQHHP
ncbi:MAG: hypothetical protein H6741_18975 [Alphaproteobacteria bacterium]|nr:hypothetical protein [Alphaproteobacteria bacterium]MCB9794794.1 hypothetical protein [Alphaproteobacteria bacterium]